jgi:adenylate cyclase
VRVADPAERPDSGHPAGWPDPGQIEELLLGAQRRYTAPEVAAMTGLDLEFLRRLWRALGLPQQSDEAVAFTDDDVTGARIMTELLKLDPIDEEAAIRLARAMGQTMSRLAGWQVDIVNTTLLDPRVPPTPEQITGVLAASEMLVPRGEAQIGWVWRRHVAAAGIRALAVVAANEDASPNRIPLAAGFADLVGFTEFSRELDEVELAALVEGFEATAADIVIDRGGRVVKTLGDEVLFTAERAASAADIALRLEDTFAGAEGPRVRIGLAFGPVLPLLGDYFGTTVNLASRLTSVARPGTVLVDEEVAVALAGDDRFRLVRVPRKLVRGLGWIQPYALRPG